MTTRFFPCLTATALLAAGVFAPIAGVAAADQPQKGVYLTVPVAANPAASQAALDKARAAGTGYLVDLTTGQDGVAFTAKPDVPLAPGRCRLHLLIGSGPAGNDVVDPVELRLSAGEAVRRIGPKDIPRNGALAEFSLDFTVTAAKPAPVSLHWFVGDSLLEVSPQEKGKAFQNLLKRRVAEIAKARPAADDQGDALLDRPGDGEPEAAEAAARPVPLTTAIPKYRLAVAGVHLETLCPVAVVAVQCDRDVYEPGDAIAATAVLRNWGTAAEEVTLTAEEAPAKAARGAAPTAKLDMPWRSIPPGANTTVKLPANAFITRGLSGICRITVSIACRDLRPATGEVLFAMAPPAREARPQDKQVFAHYMGCWPAGTGALRWQRENEGKELRHEAAPGSAYSFGGHVRNFDLLDPAAKLTPEESADLEIRRALRIGIDGFAIDAWAGGNDARRSLDALFAAAEAKDYPFAVTVCIDTSCGGNAVDTVKELLDKHGKSPKLARRNGKPLIFGYMNVFAGYANLAQYVPDRVEAFRTEPIGWHILGQGLLDAAHQVGQPVYYHYCMSAFFHNVDKARVPAHGLTLAAAVIARYADAISGFTWLGSEQPEISKQVRAAGAEWGMPVGMYQKENIPFECYVPKGTDWMHWGQAALDQGSTLIQVVTWNDYGENTNIAPAWNTRYTLYDLTAYEIALWKTGKAPAPDRDRVYLIYRKYPKGVKIFPFHSRFPEVDGGVIEVLTILPKPATLRLPGRDVEFAAPAGYSRKQFPVTVGPMVAELLRDGKVELRLESPEPITDKPFREDNSLVCWSTEEERLWQEDFGNTPPFWYSEYGDSDKDALPNWFEMYWFSQERGYKPKGTEREELDGADEVRYSRWADFTTAGFADPKADPDGDGRSNLQEYQQQTDPTQPAPGSITPGE